MDTGSLKKLPIWHNGLFLLFAHSKEAIFRIIAFYNLGQMPCFSVLLNSWHTQEEAQPNKESKQTKSVAGEVVKVG